MKQVVIIDESSVFRDFISEKFESQNTSLSVCIGKLDSLSKMRSLLPDLAIIDYTTAKDFLFDLLEEKSRDPNAKSIPVILMAHELEKAVLNRLASLGVRKIIPKPVKIDQLFSAVSGYLGIDFTIDLTPCILEARVNEGIIFIEIAQGLNREKIDLLKYRIRELIELYDLASPKILVMLSDLSLSFADGTNLELLLNNILSDHRIRNRNIRVLTLDSFARDFISGNKEYREIDVVDNLTKAVESLIREPSHGEDLTTVISERLLSAGKDAPGIANFEMRFKSELETLRTTAKDIRIAVVDDDVVIRTILDKTFQSINAKVDLFESGVAFLASGKASRYSLVFLDLIMPELNGFQVLQKLREQNILSPVIVLSAVSKREAVLKALSSGVKSYLIKPLEPHMILKKAIDVLKAAL
ncbi:MAG TPA: response regulator [Treponemataceae bacterium]|nr:response regulator [Treponemataceae bacterium]